MNTCNLAAIHRHVNAPVENQGDTTCVVKVGQRNGLCAQILAGLAGRESVITHPDNTIVDGVFVKQR